VPHTLSRTLSIHPLLSREQDTLSSLTGPSSHVIIMSLPQRDRRFHPIDPQRVVIRKGPLWIAVSVFLLVPFIILNIQLYLYADPVEHTDPFKEQDWRLPSSSSLSSSSHFRILGESSTARCILKETTKELFWVTPDRVQILIVLGNPSLSSSSSQPDQLPQWWFLPDPGNSTKLQIVSGYIQGIPHHHQPLEQPHQQQKQQQDPFRFTTTMKGGRIPTTTDPDEDEDVSPWYAAQRIVQEQQWGIPSNLFRIVDYDGVYEGEVAPFARTHWTLLGKFHLDSPPSPRGDDGGSGQSSSFATTTKTTIYTYLWQIEEPPDGMTAVSITNLTQAIQEERFTGMSTLASLGLILGLM